MRLTGPSEVCTVVYAMDTVIHIRLSAGAMAALDEKARVEGRSRNWVARRILEGGLSNGVFGRTGGSGIQISEQWASGAQSSAGRDARTAGRVRAVRTEDSEDDDNGSISGGHERGGHLRDRILAGVAQKEEQRFRKPQVAGSTPAVSSKDLSVETGIDGSRPEVERLSRDGTSSRPAQSLKSDAMCEWCGEVGGHLEGCSRGVAAAKPAPMVKSPRPRAGGGVSVTAKGGPVLAACGHPAPCRGTLLVCRMGRGEE